MMCCVVVDFGFCVVFVIDVYICMDMFVLLVEWIVVYYNVMFGGLFVVLMMIEVCVF